MALNHNSTLADNEPDWGSYLSENRSRLPDQAFADREERGFPHHWVRDGAGEDAEGRYTTGEMFLHKAGLMAAFAAAMGARTGQRAGQDIIDHLEAHRRAIGMGEEAQRMAAEEQMKGQEGENTGTAARKEIRRLLDAGMTLIDISEALAKIGEDASRSPEVLALIRDGKIKNPPSSLIDALRSIKPPKDSENRMASMVSVLRAIGDKGEAEIRVLFDTGAGESFVLRSVAEKITTIVKLPRPFKITFGDGKTSTVIKETAVLAIEAAGQTIIDTFLILESGIEDIVLGESTMRKFGLKIDLEHGAVFSELKAAERKEPSMWKKFLAALGINVNEEPTEEKAIELVKAKVAEIQPTKIVASKGVMTILGLAETASEDEVKGKILALQNRGDMVSRAEHETLLNRVKEQEIEQAIAAAMQGEEAKLTPAMRPAALQIAKDHGIDTLKSYIAGLPKLGIFIKLPEKKEDKGAAKIDDVQAQINRQLGLSQETFLKYNAQN